MYADERLKAMIVQEALTKKVLRPSLRKEMARQAINDHQVTVRLACQAFKISETAIGTIQSYHPRMN